MYQPSRQSDGSDTLSLPDQIEFGSFENLDGSDVEEANDPPLDAQPKKSDNEKVADNNLAFLVNEKPSAAVAAAVEFGSSYDNPIDLEDSDFEEENDPPLSAQAENNLTSSTNPKSSVDVSALEILPPDECKHREKRNSRSRLLCKVAGCNTEGRKNQDDMCARHFSMFSSNGVGTCQAAPEARKQSKKRQALKQLECELSSPKNTRSRGTIRRKRGTAI